MKIFLFSIGGAILIFFVFDILANGFPSGKCSQETPEYCSLNDRELP